MRTSCFGKNFRAWEGLLPSSRILIYCRDHKIYAKTATPRRDHLAFPKKGPLDSQSSELIAGPEKKSKKFGSKHVTRPSTKLYGSSGVRISPKKNLKVKGLPEQLYQSSRSQLSHSSVDSRMRVSNKDTYSKYNRRLSHLNDDQSKATQEAANHTVMPSCAETYSSLISEDAKFKRRALELLESSDALFGEEDNLIDRERPRTYDIKKITMGKVMASVEAIQAALQILDAGGSLEDAKRVCPPEIIIRLMQWKFQLRVYLNPFIVGDCYTSHGRHFTKVEKLREIVDFCCGSNDFSCLMKEALDRMGKKCSFKNYDLIQTKNDFCFEKKDWMNVRVEDLPCGDKLIMGLNPPFGAHATMANKFIKKALTFNPKLLILIVPEETTRLPYELIWQDNQLLAGKSFYIPGSVDENGNIMEQSGTSIVSVESPCTKL